MSFSLSIPNSEHKHFCSLTSSVSQKPHNIRHTGCFVRKHMHTCVHVLHASRDSWAYYDAHQHRDRVIHQPQAHLTVSPHGLLKVTRSSLHLRHLSLSLPDCIIIRQSSTATGANKKGEEFHLTITRKCKNSKNDGFVCAWWAGIRESSLTTKHIYCTLQLNTPSNTSGDALTSWYEIEQKENDGAAAFDLERSSRLRRRFRTEETKQMVKHTVLSNPNSGITDIL